MKNFRHQHQRPKKNTLVIGQGSRYQGYEGREGSSTGSTCSQPFTGPLIDEIKEAWQRQYMVPINKVPVEKLNSFNVSNHEGCIAQISKIQYQDLQQVISFVVDKGEVPLFLMLGRYYRYQEYWWNCPKCILFWCECHHHP
ncbi:MAG: hypothetical protein V9E83_11880 [Baekduia sp.]